jgi:hypothetical protein
VLIAHTSSTDCLSIVSSVSISETFVAKKMEKKEEDDTPLVGIFCLKTRQDMKRFEETEDCFILDFDPFDSFDVKKLTFTDDVREGDKDLSIIHETGQV